jgi:glutathione S-transferase
VSLVLYDNPGSSNVMKVRLLLAEIREEYKRVRVPLPRPQPDMEHRGGRWEHVDEQDELVAAIGAVRPKFDLLEWLIAGNGTITGEFTIADCFAPVLWRWQRLPRSLEPWPKVTRLREAVNARPSLPKAEFIA